MYQNAAILAAVVLVYSAIAGRVARSWLSGPILFVAAGLVVGPLGLNVLHLEITANDLRVLAEAALASAAHPPAPADTSPDSRQTAKLRNPVPTRPGKGQFWLIADFRSTPSIGAVPASPGGLLSAVISLLG